MELNRNMEVSGATPIFFTSRLRTSAAWTSITVSAPGVISNL